MDTSWLLPAVFLIYMDINIEWQQKNLLYLFSLCTPVIFPFGKTWMWKPMPTLQYSLLSLFIPSRYSPSLAVTSLLSQELLLAQSNEPALRRVCLLLLMTGRGAKKLHRRIPYMSRGSLDLDDDILCEPVAGMVEAHNKCVFTIPIKCWLSMYRKSHRIFTASVSQRCTKKTMSQLLRSVKPRGKFQCAYWDISKNGNKGVPLASYSSPVVQFCFLPRFSRQTTHLYAPHMTSHATCCLVCLWVTDAVEAHKLRSTLNT